MGGGTGVPESKRGKTRSTSLFSEEERRTKGEAERGEAGESRRIGRSK